MKFIFHAGMGKTGSSSIQAALSGSEQVLREHGAHYLGMWAPWMGAEYDDFAGFRRFLDMPKARMDGLSDLFLAYAKRISDETGTQTFIHSNEDWPHADFFKAVGEKAEIEVLIYVRAPDRWLPSAYLQWGVLHKTRRGSIPAFGDAARKFLSQYERVRIDWEALGPRLVVRPYPENGDVIPDFSEMICIPLIAPARRYQSRPGVAETILRASFNEAVPEEQLPHLFNAATGLPWAPLPSARARYDRLFDRSELPAILAENEPLFGWFESEFGIPMGLGGTSSDPAPSFEELADGLLGYLIDLSCAQARRSFALQARLEQVEASLAQGAPAAGADAGHPAMAMAGALPPRPLPRIEARPSGGDAPISQAVERDELRAPAPIAEQADSAQQALDTRAEQLSADLAKSREAQGRLEHLLAEARRELAVLKSDAAHSMRTELEAQLSKRELEALRQDLAASRAELERLRNQDRQRDDEVQALRRQRDEDLRTLRDRKNQEIRALQAQRDEDLRALRERKDAQLKTLRERREAQARHVTELERHLKELQASTSWRITGPLRRVRLGWRRT